MSSQPPALLESSSTPGTLALVLILVALAGVLSVTL